MCVRGESLAKGPFHDSLCEKKNTRAGRAVMMAYKKARLNGKPYSSALDPGPRTQAAPPTPATPLLLPPTLPLAEDDDDVDDGNVL